MSALPPSLLPSFPPHPRLLLPQFFVSREDGFVTPPLSLPPSLPPLPGPFSGILTPLPLDVTKVLDMDAAAEELQLECTYPSPLPPSLSPSLPPSQASSLLFLWT